MHSNFLIADFMGDNRCKCNDFGWDGLSRSIHYECGICKNHHMESKFPYDRDLNKILEVVDKLRIKGYSTRLDNSSTKWTATVDEYSHTADTLVEAIYRPVTDLLRKIKA